MAGPSKRLRALLPDEIGVVRRFYRDIDNPNIRMRPPEELDPAVRNGFFLVVQERHSRRLLAAAALFETYDADYDEIGGLLVHPDHEGRGYAKLLYTCLIMQSFFFNGPDRRIFAKVKPGNERALSWHQRMGFRPWLPMREDSLRPVLAPGYVHGAPFHPYSGTYLDLMEQDPACRARYLIEQEPRYASTVNLSIDLPLFQDEDIHGEMVRLAARCSSAG